MGQEHKIANIRHLAEWSVFLRLVRQVMYDLDLREVTTPSLVINPGMEPELEPFATQWRKTPGEGDGQSESGRRAANAVTRFLPTSPELHMKKLIAAGFHNIFEIKTVFRNEEVTDIHRPEFQMLEWYRTPGDLEVVLSDLQRLVETLLQWKRAGGSGSGGSSASIRSFGASPENSTGAVPTIPASTIPITTIAILFDQHLNFQLSPSTTLAEMQNLAKTHGAGNCESWTWNDCFHFVYVAKIENKFPEGLLIVRDFPPSQAALAKINNSGWADRFELYWDGVEIANAFFELTDPVEQRKRFEHDQKMRLKYGRTPLEIDEEFMTALQMGLPKTGGIAVGLDRLFLKLLGYEKLSEVLPFQS